MLLLLMVRRDESKPRWCAKWVHSRNKGLSRLAGPSSLFWLGIWFGNRDCIRLNRVFLHFHSLSFFYPCHFFIIILSLFHLNSIYAVRMPGSDRSMDRTKTLISPS